MSGYDPTEAVAEVIYSQTNWRDDTKPAWDELDPSEQSDWVAVAQVTIDSYQVGTP